jgi:hypothetical protein
MSVYSYLIFSLSLLPLWLAVFIYRKDLRPRLIKSSLVGIACGWLSEIWLKADYWNPVSFWGSTNTIIEDGVLGFLLLGLSATLYDAIFGLRTVKNGSFKYKEFYYTLLLGTSLLLAATFLLNINSMVAFCALFILFSAYTFYKAPHTIYHGLTNGIIFLLLFFGLYALLFIVISPAFWSTIVLDTHAVSKIFLLESFPLIEMPWYFCWGLFSYTFCNYITCSQKINTSVANVNNTSLTTLRQEIAA